jgi:hypothetical protein
MSLAATFSTLSRGHLMPESSQIFAFDVRHAPASFVASRWDEASREAFLLRPEIKYPLSASDTVWPSIFADPEGSYFAFPEGIHVEKGRDGYFDTFRLWKNVDEMIHAHEPRENADCGIAMGLVPRELYPGPQSSVTEDWLNAVLSGSCHPSSPAPGWQRIGYDVIDMLCISALCDCGFPSPEEREAERKRWAACLNDFGLFDTVSDASSFCVHAHQRIREHAPFLVFELFMIWGMDHLR